MKASGLVLFFAVLACFAAEPGDKTIRLGSRDKTRELNPNARPFLFVQPQANVGQLLFELRRNREHMAALV